MTTITAKDLRDNLDQIVQRVRRGETIRVTYRSLPAFRLEPDVPETSEPKPGSPKAMKKFLQLIEEVNQTHRQSSLDPHKSVKDQYHQLLDTDPKYHGSNGN